VLFAEAPADEPRELLEGDPLVLALDDDPEPRTLRRGEGEQAQDRLAVHARAVLRDRDARPEGVREVHEPRGRPRVEAEAVRDRDLRLDHSVSPSGPVPRSSRTDATWIDRFPCSAIRCATSGRAASSRRFMNLISIGRLTPVTTSTFPGSSSDSAMFVGVPPNMSVSTRTPPPFP